jgi:hypothetical protein
MNKEINMKNKIKTITAAAISAMTILSATPITSLAASYTRPVYEGDYWRIETASTYHNCNDRYRVVIVGDANEDGCINIADVVRIQNVVNYGFTAPEPNSRDARLYLFFNSNFPDHMDINGDGAITQRDVNILMSFCCNNPPKIEV